MSLITEYEVIYSSPLNLDFSPKWLSDIIEDTEENYMDRCFGFDFYQVMLDDLAIPTQGALLPYNGNTTYGLGDMAIWEGRVIESQAAANQGQAVNEPSYWQFANKFSTQLYQDLWIKYLQRIVAMECALPAITFSTFKAMKGGLTKTNSIETGMVAATRGEIGVWKDQMRNQIDRAERNMMRWIDKEVDKDSYNDEFEEMNFIGDFSCSPKKGTKYGKRRFFFRN